jgi:hypothetical protein
VFLYRELPEYSDQPWLIGRYMPLADLTGEVRRLERAAWIGLGAVLAAVVLASEVVLEAIGASASAHTVHRYTLRGRREPTTVVRLL